MRAVRLAWHLLAIALLGACSGCQLTKTEPKQAPPKPARAAVVLRIKPAPDLNPNDRGEPTPLDLRVYQLTERPSFTEAPFEELWTSDREALGSALLGEPTILTFQPEPSSAAPSAHELRLDPATQFIGLMGLFSAERKEGLEQRKLCLSVDEAAQKVLLLTEHRIEIKEPAEVAPPKPAEAPAPGDGEAADGTDGGDSASSGEDGAQ